MEQTYDLTADSFRHRLVYQYGPFRRRPYVSGCKLFWMAVVSLLCFPLYPIYSQSWGKQLLGWGTLAAWIGLHIYRYDVVVAAVIAHAKNSLAPLMELGFSWWPALALAITINVELGLIACIMFLCVMFGLLAGCIFAVTWIEGLYRRAPDSVKKYLIDPIAAFIAWPFNKIGEKFHRRRNLRDMRRLTEAPRPPRFPRLARVRENTADVFAMLFEWLEAKKQRICPIYSVEPLKQ